MDASVTVSGKKGRPPADAERSLNGPARTQEKRYRSDAPHLAFAAEKEVAEEYA